MWRGRVVGYGLVFLDFLCQVRCQRIVHADTDVDPKVIWTPEPGRTSSVGEHYAQWRPTVVQTTGPLTSSSSLHGGGRTRRNVIFKNFNATKGIPLWTHKFAVESYFSDESKRSFVEKEVDILKNKLQSMDFEFLNPIGLRISFPDGNKQIIIFKFYIRLNEVIGESVGDFATSFSRRFRGWTMLAPVLNVEPGDEVNYQIHALLDKEQLNVTIDGVLEIEGEDPARFSGANSELVQFCPTKGTALGAETHAVSQITLSQIVRWSHRFTIGPSYPGGFTKKSAKTWIEKTSTLKYLFEKYINFKFVNSTGLMVELPALFRNVLELNVKVGEDFKVLDSGHYVAYVAKGWEAWYYPNLNVKKGDKIYYWMRTIYISVDNTVRGELEVTHENPYTRQSIVNLAHAECDPEPTEKDDGRDYFKSLKQNHNIAVYTNSNDTFTMESAKRWHHDARELEYSLKIAVKLELYYPSGLKIYIDEGLLNGMKESEGVLKRIIEENDISGFNVQLENDFGYLNYDQNTDNMSKLTSTHVWKYYYPNLKVSAGLKVFYSMRVIFGEEMWDNVVRGVFEIYQKSNEGNYYLPSGEGAYGGGSSGGSGGGTYHVKPFVRVKSIQSRPSSITPSTFVGDLPGGTVEGAFRWSNRFTITAPSDASFTNESVQKWLEDAQRLKNMLKDELNFKFVNSTCLRITMPDFNPYYSKWSFDIPANGKQKNKNPMDGADIEYTNMDLKAGDKIEYSLKLSLPKHNFKGQLEIFGL